jgi:hypothetical protein
VTDFSIVVDLGDVLPPGSSLTKDAFPNLSYAVQNLAVKAQEQWMRYARGEPMPDGRSIGIRSGGYLRSIQLRQVNDFAAEVYSELPYATALEEGMPARDMKKMLGSSWKVRVSKKGKRYLIIPFRHDTPGSVQGNPMPQAVHEWWKAPNREASHITGAHERVSGALGSSIATRRQMTVPGRSYHWGSRLSKAALQGLGADQAQVRRMAGMVHFRNPESGGHSSFITFRVMSEDSPGWQAPATPGFWPARTTSDQLRPIAETIFARALQTDIQALLTPA